MAIAEQDRIIDFVLSVVHEPGPALGASEGL